MIRRLHVVCHTIETHLDKIILVQIVHIELLLLVIGRWHHPIDIIVFITHFHLLVVQVTHLVDIMY